VGNISIISSTLEGESLVNDATGLIAYKYAVAAVISEALFYGKRDFNFC